MMLRHHVDNLNRRVLQYQEGDTVNDDNDTVKSVNLTANLRQGFRGEGFVFLELVG